MGIGDAGRPGPRERHPGSSRVRTVERHEVRAGLSNQPAEAGLPRRVSNGLSQRRRRNGNAHAAPGRPCQECDYAAILPIQGDQPAGVHSDSVHAAFRFREPALRCRGERIPSAQRAFLLRQGAARLPQGVGEHVPPSRRVIQSDSHGVLYKRGNAGRLTGRYKGVDLGYPIVL